MRRALAPALASVALLGAGTLTPVHAQAVDRLSLVVTPQAAKVGDRILVRLEGWTSTAVTLNICGNLASRGAPDCDVTGGQGLGLIRSGPTLTDFKVTAPPTTCPCVVRASSATNNEVRTAPLVVLGVPVGPVVKLTTPELMELSAKVSEVRRGLRDTLRALLGGRVHHKVTIAMRNTSGVALSRVSLGVTLGRQVEGAATVDVPDVTPLQPGETRVYEVLTTIAAPARGRYVWDVTVDGAGPRAAVQGRSSVTPWLLYVLLMLLIADLGAYAVVRARRRRDRRRARRQAAAQSTDAAAWAAAWPPAGRARRRG